MTCPAAEAAFAKLLDEHRPDSLSIHRAFVAGWEARGRHEEERLGGASRTIDRDELPNPEKP